MKTVSEGKNHKAINIGGFSHLNDHTFVHPKFHTENEGRIFIGELLKTTGVEISFRELPAKTTIPFLHKHHEHEEIYIFLKGEGLFQVDDDVFDISEGSIVRVDVDGNRTLSNTATDPMVYMVIQAQRNSLRGYDVSDGYRAEGEIKL